MEKEQIIVEFLCIEDFFIKTFKYLDELKILLTKLEKINIAIQLFDKISIFSIVKSVKYKFVIELYELYENSKDDI